MFGIHNFELIGTPLSWVLAVLGVLLVVLQGKKSWTRKAHYTPPSPSSSKTSEPQYSESSYYDIEPLPDFDITKTEPLKLRPFKPKFHMTMALESTTPSDLIAMDRTFASRCSLRKSLIATHRHETIAANPRSHAAVLELYHWLVNTYLPTRFPSVYTLTGHDLRNNITGALLPTHLHESPDNVERALQLMGENIDDEFLFLLPSPIPSDEHKYRLEAFITCFPSGFNTRSKLNLLLSQIHTPVPGYAAKLEKSMDRYFANLPVGKVVRRANWSISTNGELFCLKGNHMSADELAARDSGEGIEEIDLAKTVLRCERQTLHRLPRTRALVFAFKTYTYPISDLRDEGSGEILAEAIDGLGTGSVPDITIYKRQVVWGDKVKAFLRGEIEA
ncbi:hypothetical protein FB567DRAFT_334188 [Paraphoma chrysanthemicola]|uniref:HRQ family protein 2 n=1 Tax=Paraphoma chrysanthemicola TaxID=798071 RepID=A0A8K0VYS6_9PLEO|nr:hypothetical protein FB567DRAFT_334188 [Paraphoma chrysanthemicola]